MAFGWAKWGPQEGKDANPSSNGVRMFCISELRSRRNYQEIKNGG